MVIPRYCVLNLCYGIFFEGLKFFFVPLFELDFFSKTFVELDPCAVAKLLDDSEGDSFGCKFCISFDVGIFIIFDFAPDSRENQFQGLMFENIFFCGLSRRI